MFGFGLNVIGDINGYSDRHTSISVLSVLVLRYKLMRYEDGSIIIASTVISDIMLLIAKKDKKDTKLLSDY